MASLLFALAALLLAAPDDAPAPPRQARAEAAGEVRAALDAMAGHLKAGGFVALFEGLSDTGRKKAAPIVAAQAGRLGLAPGTEPTKVVAAFEKQVREADPKLLARLAETSVAVRAVKVDGEAAAAVVRVELRPGKVQELDVKLTREGGAWKVDSLQPRVPPKRDANEAMAVATLRNLTAAQAQFQATGRADVDADGVGEYGFFGELSGAAGVRGGPVLNPPVLSSAFRRVEHGTVTRGGYRFRLYLCGPKGGGVVEPAKPDELDTQRAETLWCCYAWPVEHGRTGTRTFFVPQFGDILATDAKKYSGANGPSASAAFRPGPDGPKDKMDGATANGTKGNDGETWKQVG